MPGGGRGEGDLVPCLVFVSSYGSFWFLSRLARMNFLNKRC